MTTETVPTAVKTRRNWNFLFALTLVGLLVLLCVALSIATRYALERRQFAAPGSRTEVVLMDYRTHQRRLLPAIATSEEAQRARPSGVPAPHPLHESP